MVQIKPNYLIAYKVFVTIYTFAWLVLSIVCYARSPTTPEHNWFYYLHNQIYVVLVAYYLMSTGLLIHVYYQHVRMVRVRDVINKLNAAATGSNHETSLRQMVNQWSSEGGQASSTSSTSAPPKAFLLVLWALYTILVPLAYTVTLEWLINIDSHLANIPDTLRFAVIINFSIVNSIIITFELILSLIPIRIYHFYLPVLYACFYTLVVYLLWLGWPDSSGKLKFEAFWLDGFSVKAFFGYLGFILTVHVIHALIYRFKLWVYYDVLLPRIDNDQNEQTQDDILAVTGSEDTVFDRYQHIGTDKGINSIEQLASMKSNGI